MADEEEISEPEEAEEDPPPEGAPAWMATYGDMVTLLFAFFVLLFAMGSPEKAKFLEVQQSLTTAFGTLGLIDAGTPTEEDENDPPPDVEQKKMTSIVKKQMEEIEQDVKDLITYNNLQGKVKVATNESGVTISISDVLLFSAGQARLSRQGAKNLKKLATMLSRFSYPLMVTGHTDNRPIRTAQFPSNWELSGLRACEVVRKLIDYGVDPKYLAPVGYAQYKQIAPNTSARGRAQNRRVEITFEKQKIIESRFQ